MTTTTRSTPAKPAPAAASPATTSSSGANRGLTPPPKLRRRPALIAVSIALIALGALVSVWAYTSSRASEEVLGARETIVRGQTITAADLITVRISVDPALRPVAAARQGDVVGQRAAMDISAGGVLTDRDVTADVLPPQGQSVVGVSLTPAMMPADLLVVGDRVRAVTTPGQQGASAPVAAEQAPTSLPASVVGIEPREDGSATVVNVQVASDDAPALAAQAATATVALVLDTRER